MTILLRLNPKIVKIRYSPDLIFPAEMKRLRTKCRLSGINTESLAVSAQRLRS